MRLASYIVAWAALVIVVPSAAEAAGNFPAFLNGKTAGPDFQIQGEYRGKVQVDGAEKVYGVQVIARGEGKFEAVVFSGGLPGAGWRRGGQQQTAASEQAAADGKVTLVGPAGKLVIDSAARTLTMLNSGGEKLGELKRVTRRSPTLEAKPPENAVVLFDGQNKDQFEGGRLTKTGLLLIPEVATPAAAEEAGAKKPARPARQNIYSKEKFGDFTLHIEFRTPFMPTATGQARGNSGLYLQDRYEVQILDSFGLEGLDNECGGIYKSQQPTVNMCLPPLSWQTYDIDFTAPRFDAEGKKTANARVSLRHNGVQIYDNLELNGVTPGGDSQEGPTGPLKLQDHGNPVSFRNIWIVPR